MTPKQKQARVEELKNIIKDYGFIEDRYGNFKIEMEGVNEEMLSYRIHFKKNNVRFESLIKRESGNTWLKMRSYVITKIEIHQFITYIHRRFPKTQNTGNNLNAKIIENTEIKGDTKMTTENKTNEFMEALKHMIKTNSGITQANLIEMTGRASSTVRSYLDKLRDQNLIIKGFDDDNKMTIIWLENEKNEGVTETKHELTPDPINETKQETEVEEQAETKQETEVEEQIENNIDEAIKTEELKGNPASTKTYVVYFQVKEELKKSLDSFKNQSIEDRIVDLAAHFRKIQSIEADSKENAFLLMQNTNLDQKTIKDLGVVHSSMSIGDILMDKKGNLFRMTGSGWVKVKEGQVPKKQEKEKKEKKEKKSSGKKGPGIIEVIIDCLETPVSKEEILEILVEKFPEKEASKMKKTVNCQVPYRLRTDKGMILKKDKENRYWVEK